MINSVSFTGTPAKAWKYGITRNPATGRVVKYPPNMERPKTPPEWLESLNKKLRSIERKHQK